MSDFHKNLRPALLSSPSYLGSEAIYHDFDQVAANFTKTYICQQTNMLPIIRNTQTVRDEPLNRQTGPNEGQRNTEGRPNMTRESLIPMAKPIFFHQNKNKSSSTF